MKVTNSLGNEYSGTLGESLTAVKRDGVNFLRAYVVPRDPRTPAQMRQRELYKNANIAWRSMAPSEKEARYLRDGSKAYVQFVSEFASH